VPVITPEHRILVRYKEGDEVQEEVLDDAGPVGTNGRLVTYGGKLRFEAYRGDFELESAALFDVDVTPSLARMAGVPRWTRQKLSIGQHVPIKVPLMEEGTTNLITLGISSSGFNSYFGFDEDVT